MKLIDIHSPQDIKPLTIDDLKDLAKQMRAAIINYTSTIGGHVGPNLGDVEALIGVHYVFDAPKDKIVIDVSHQDFVHKMLTGRAQYYLDKSKFTEIGEFTDPNESPEYDIFYAGHTSPSISLAFGLAKARSLKNEKFNIVAFIGDGSLSGGVAFEGLNNAGKLNDNFIVIVNDNQMAIAENHGSLYDNLRELRETNGQSEHNYFKSLGYDYIYVAEGNDLESVINALKKAKDTKNPIVVHLNTQKGEGYAPAEAHREEFHFSAPYDVADGEPLQQSNEPNYITNTRDYLLRKVKENPELLIISSATPEVFGFMEKERKACGNQYVDVAIAEQTGVSTMAGAARGGAKVIYPVMATFLQRAYDQLEQDWAMDNSPAVMPVMGTGIRALTDLTHLGFWDIPMITSIPEIVYLAPTNVEEYFAMMDWALNQAQTGVSTMAGAARGGAKVIYPVMATFLQRAYDQLEQDWAMDNSPAVMPVMGTGIRALTDLTHLGFWDIPMITSIPEIVYLAPTNVEEYFAMMDWALNQNEHKVAIRVPTYSYEHSKGEVDTDYSDLNKFKVVKEGKDVAVIAAGDFFVKGESVVDALAEKGINATLINPRFVSGVDTELLNSLKQNHKVVVVLEDGSKEGGFGGRIAQAVGATGMKCLTYGLEKKFVDRYNPEELEKAYRLTVPQIVEDTLNALK